MAASDRALDVQSRLWKLRSVAVGDALSEQVIEVSSGKLCAEN